MLTVDSETMNEAGFGFQNRDGLELDDPRPYFDEAELARDFHRGRVEALEFAIQEITVPGWGFLFAMSDDATEDQVAELHKLAARHFRKHAVELERLKTDRDHHLREAEFFESTRGPG